MSQPAFVDKPLVSVAIPTLNSERTLPLTLESIRRQNYKNYEIIVVDGHSVDRTVEIAQRHEARILYGRTIAEARRIGVDNCKGKYVLLLDSDQVLEADTIDKCVQRCEREGVDVITLFERSILLHNTIVARAIAYDKWLIHSMHDDDVLYGTAIPRFFKTELLKKSSWPLDLVTLDHTFLYSSVLVWKPSRAFLDSYIWHIEPTDLASIARKFFHYGLSYSRALRQNKSLTIWHSLPRRVYFSGKALQKPYLLAIVLLIYLVKGLACVCGIAASLGFGRLRQTLSQPL